MAETQNYVVEVLSKFDPKGFDNLIKAVDHADAKVKTAQQTLQSFGKIFLAGGTVFAAFATIKSGVEKFNELDNSIRLVDRTLKGLGAASARQTKELKDLAAASEGVTKFQEEQILQATKLAAEMGYTGNNIKRVITASMDLATAWRIDLSSAMNLVSMAVNGQDRTFKRYGLTMDENMSRSDKFEKIMAFVNDKFSDARTKELSDYDRAVYGLKQAFDDTHKTLGNLFIPGMTELLKLTKDTVSWWDRLARSVLSVNDGSVTELGIKTKQKEIELTKEHLKSYGNNYTKQRQQLETLLISQEKELAVLERQLAKEKEISKEQDVAAGVGGQKGADFGSPFLPKKLSLGPAIDPIADFKKAIDEKLRMQIDFQNEMARHNDEILAYEESINKQKLQNLSDTFGAISALTSSSNETLIGLGKIAASGQVIMSTSVGMMKAWELGPILGPILAPLVAIAGAAQLANIAGIALAEGGMIKAKKGGVLAQMGEAGKDEVAIPLDDSRTKSKLRDVLGGGQNITFAPTINITGSMSSEMDVKKIAKIMITEMKNQTATWANDFATVAYKMGARRSANAI